MRRILLVEDDLNFVNQLKHQHNRSFEITSFSTGEQFIRSLNNLNISSYDAIILDLRLPDTDGISLLEYLKTNCMSTPAALILTENETTQGRLAAYRLGVSDFLSKDLTADEIEVRVNNSINLFNTNHHELKFENLSLVSQSMECFVNNDPVALTKIEFKILSALLQKPDSPQKRDEIMKTIWPSKSVSRQTLNTHIFNINLKTNEWKRSISIDSMAQIKLVNRAK